ncbi:MAG: hypothetical protein ACN4GM_04480 [Gammaproteobacteria bacterium]
MTATSLTVSAGKDPFKKNKDYKFLGDTSWYKKGSSVLKAGRVKESGDTFYYHLSVNSKHMRLHLGKNDPSGELKDTRQLDYMSITEVAVDGKTLARFKWCLNNQDGASNSLKKHAKVAGGTCVNAGDDFYIKMDDKTLKQLMSAKTISFAIEPFGDSVKLTYGMNGFAGLMKELKKPVVAKKPNKPIKVNKPKKPRPVVKTEPTCYAQPPAQFKSSVKNIAYPCGNAGKKSAATKSVNQMVDKQRKQQQAALDRKRVQDNMPKHTEITSEEELEFEKKQAERWITRCQIHWGKGVSPCYCKKYMKFAPAGVQDDCAN